MRAEFSDPIAAALAEDIGDGDVTSEFFVEPNRLARALIVARQTCVLAGGDVARQTFLRVDSNLKVRVQKTDGAHLAPGEQVVRVEGRARSILAAERVALNFIQRLSGIATLTARFVEAVAGTGVKILDTRKTTPGLRVLEKAAVKAGGGTNHRMGLHDMVLVKDNHLVGNTDIQALRTAIARARADRPGIRIELEADQLEQVAAFLTLDEIDVILLDNMTTDQLRQAVALRAQLGMQRVQFEASGGVNLGTVRGIAETGVDAISAGALTHSAIAVDFGLDFQA
ncbi:nicotinate-nucleotide pyrophosphorylase [Verrucomicrobia bacterium SCGC AG-212-E04]|nr:nicotinate-nucleotide pyrophosphorylase [Verrucomicrobia bacterium SCGC AG-212-E04]